MTQASTNYIKDGAVTSPKLGENSVSGDKIQPNAIINTHINDRTIAGIKLLLGAITSDELGNNSVIPLKIANSALEQRHYSNSSIPQAALQKPSVGTTEVIDLAITGAKLANDAVGSDKIADQAVQPNHLATGLIGDATVPTNTFSTNRLKDSVNHGALLHTTGVSKAWQELAPPSGSGQFVLSSSSPSFVPTWSSSLVFTGVLIDYVGAIAPTGWLLANGKTIGPALSGATGRAHSDTYNLFMLLWASGFAVTPSKGSTAQADWEAGNKVVALPDLRSRSTIGRDSMDNSAAGRLPVGMITNSKTPDDIGSVGGQAQFNMTANMLPAHKHFMFQSGQLSGHGPPLASPTQSSVATRIDIGGTSYEAAGLSTNPEPSVSPTSTTGSGGVDGVAHDNMSPFITMSKIIRL